MHSIAEIVGDVKRKSLPPNSVKHERISLAAGYPHPPSRAMVGEGPPRYLGPKSRKKFSKNPPERGGAAASIPAGGDGALGSGRTGIAWVAVNMKRRHACAGSEPPVTWFIGVLSSLPSHTPATKSAV